MKSIFVTCAKTDVSGKLPRVRSQGSWLFPFCNGAIFNITFSITKVGKRSWKTELGIVSPGLEVVGIPSTDISLVHI